MDDSSARSRGRRSRRCARADGAGQVGRQSPLPRRRWRRAPMVWLSPPSGRPRDCRRPDGRRMRRRSSTKRAASSEAQKSPRKRRRRHQPARGHSDVLRRPPSGAGAPDRASGPALNPSLRLAGHDTAGDDGRGTGASARRRRRCHSARSGVAPPPPPAPPAAPARTAGPGSRGRERGGRGRYPRRPRSIRAGSRKPQHGGPGKDLARHGGTQQA